ncbi:hypothetical protein [Desulfosporosinus nitroreducens]|uniref:Uncharacterized protein n=1 Tax=Desulfosporosinus nitroreducens TaxID=2018668 RepID=A0ABT8QTV4_9FIRM|nr:hypothetical protein [Desulfosporosinus nitroreducens]MDO0823321.1 hypothetical protein [Desulfosporosinus nitroreducens]
MIHETDNINNLEVNKVNFDLEPYLEKHIRNDELAKEIRNADIVLIPYNNFREINGPIFSEETVRFYAYLTDNLGGRTVEICVEEEDYKEIALHDETFNLGIMFLNGMLLPVLVNIISEYIKSLRGEKRANVKVTVVQREENSYREFKYEGDSRYVVETVETYLKKGENDNN